MPAASLLFVLLFVAAIAGTIGLWYAIDGETDDNPRMDRADAERAARQDTDGDRDDPDDADGNGWGNDAEWGVESREE